MIIFLLVSKVNSQCLPGCYDCQKGVCLSCINSNWNNSLNKCIPSTPTQNCQLRDRDGDCLACIPVTGMVTKYSITGGKYKLECIKEVAPQKIIENCIYAVPRGHTNEVTIKDVKKTLKNIKCHICLSSSVPNSYFSECIPTTLIDNC